MDIIFTVDVSEVPSLFAAHIYMDGNFLSFNAHVYA